MRDAGVDRLLIGTIHKLDDAQVHVGRCGSNRDKDAFARCAEETPHEDITCKPHVFHELDGRMPLGNAMKSDG